MITINQILEAVYQKDIKSLSALFDAGADPNSADVEGRTPLMHAILASDASNEMIAFLLKRGANPNLHDHTQKWTALHFAARDQKAALVKTLLDGGATVDPVDVFGNTPLWRAIMDANATREIVDLLICHGADIYKANIKGVSPASLAEKLGKIQLLKN
jgi:uncharacterized protein